jgi:hypothetical protein
MRAFVRLREIFANQKEFAARLAELERKLATHDQRIQSVFEAIRQLMKPPQPSRGEIGFHVKPRQSK